MPTTPRGIWTPADSDDWDLTVDLAAMATSIDVAVGDAVTQAIAGAAPTDTSRFALSTYALPGFSSTGFSATRYGKMVTISGFIQGTFPSASSTTVSSPIPSEFRPTYTGETGSGSSGGRSAGSAIGTNGEISVLNTSGVTLTAVRISICFYA